MRAILSATFVLVAACGDDGFTAVDGAPSGDAAVDGAGCPRVWTVEAAAGTSASIASGALTLTGTGISGSALEVYRDGLTGDFDVRFDVASFSSGGTGAFLQAAISEPVAQPARLLTAAFGTSPTVGVSAADQPGGAVELQATTTTTGTLRFARTGTTVTITATAGATTATATAPSFATQPLRLGVQLGSNAGTVGPASTATLDAFVVGSGAGVTPDAFDCDSLNQ